MQDEHQNPTDEELAVLAQSGQLSSFEELVYRYEHRMLAFLMSRCGSRQDAEDLLQQTFVAAYTAMARYDAARPFSTWLFTVASRKAIDHLRSSRRLEPEPEETLDERDPARIIHEQEQQDELWSWVQRLLPANQHTAFWLRVREEMPVKEIGRVMGLSTIHVKVLLHRARRRLAAAWPPKEETPARRREPVPISRSPAWGEAGN